MFNELTATPTAKGARLPADAGRYQMFSWFISDRTKRILAAFARTETAKDEIAPAVTGVKRKRGHITDEKY